MTAKEKLEAVGRFVCDDCGTDTAILDCESTMGTKHFLCSECLDKRNKENDEDDQDEEQENEEGT
jgi:hypothetical protein